MASRALCAVLGDEPAYPAGIIHCLMHEADVGEDEAASMFEEVTGKPLKPRTAQESSVLPLGLHLGGGNRRSS